MKRYIDADKLIAEIKRRMESHRKASADGYIIDPNRLDEDEDILSFITSLQQEQPEVDIVKEYDEQFYSDPVYGKLVNRNAGIGIARHFFELGLRAREENEK